MARLRARFDRDRIEQAKLALNLSPVERENSALDYQSKKDDEVLLHRAAPESALHFDDDSSAPRH
jgi:hypothetical protein